VSCGVVQTSCSPKKRSTRVSARSWTRPSQNWPSTRHHHQPSTSFLRGRFCLDYCNSLSVFDCSRSPAAAVLVSSMSALVFLRLKFWDYTSTLVPYVLFSTSNVAIRWSAFSAFRKAAADVEGNQDSWLQTTFKNLLRPLPQFREGGAGYIPTFGALTFAGRLKQLYSIYYK